MNNLLKNIFGKKEGKKESKRNLFNLASGYDVDDVEIKKEKNEDKPDIGLEGNIWNPF
jgi:hypothetical protein